jgi:uncharacterized protein (TIGR02001 family)
MPVQPSPEWPAHAPAAARWRTARRRCSLDRGALRGVPAFLALLVAGSAAAQLAATASVISDYRYRGITLSDRKPALQGAVTWDAPGGAYAGAFASSVHLGAPAGANAQIVAFGGYAARFEPESSFEFGGDYAAFTSAPDDNYGEVFAGATYAGISGRVSYSPRYFGQPASGTYAEIEASPSLTERVRLVAHAGVLRARYGGYYGPASAQNVVDARIGAALELEGLRVQVAWVGVSNHNAGRSLTGATSPNTVVLTLTHAF